MFVDFVNRYRAKSTRALYVSAWVKFLSLVYSARLAGASPEILEPWVAKYANDLRNGRRDLASDLRILEEQVRSPKTCQTYRSAIRTLLSAAGEGSSEGGSEGPGLNRRRSDLSPPAGDERRPGQARSEPPSQAAGGTLGAGKILRLLEHLDTRGRAILYVLVASGARPGEVFSLRAGDLDLGSRPARFRVRDSSGVVSRIAFLSREAVGAIRVYLIVRDRFVASARSRGGTRPADLLFPLSPRAFGEIWALALEKAGLAGTDPATGRRTITPRAARRFFAEEMGRVLPPPVVAELMGRQGRRLPGGGRRYTEGELAGAFLEGERAVTLHRSHGRERTARQIARLEKSIRLLREQAEERDQELARISAILSGQARDGRGREGEQQQEPVRQSPASP